MADNEVKLGYIGLGKHGRADGQAAGRLARRR